ncbi:hypothetical protein [Rhizobium cremeum]|uniref:hypothetical protein n=1 Tax=Rhizobium cremeum TaxID=2813827 RepID=UPI0039E1FD14
MSTYFFSPSTGGFYHSGIHTEIPKDHIAITEAEHAALLAAQAAGAEITAGEGGAPTALAPPIDLDALKTALRRGVDVAAERERMRYITGGAGQAMTYQRKADEARACLAAADPQPADYPMLSAEVGITAATLTGVAEVVSAAYEAWLSIGARIESTRLGAKAAIDAAKTPEDARTAAEVIFRVEN